MGTPIQEPEFTPDVVDIRHVIDIGLRARRDVMGMPASKAWRASSLGYCTRRQFFERAGVPKSKGDDGMRTLWLGDLIHSGVQRMIRDSGLLLAEEQTLEDEDLELSGHVDLIWGGAIQETDPALAERVGVFFADFVSTYRESVAEFYGEGPHPVVMSELKSAHQFSAEKMYADGAQFHHRIQAGAYRLMAERNPELLPESIMQYGNIDSYQIVVIAKGDLKMPVFDIHPSDVERALDRVSTLNTFWQEKVIPPCTCGIDISWERRYCAYRDPNSSDRSPTCCAPELIEGAQDQAFWAVMMDDEEMQRRADEEEVLPKDGA